METNALATRLLFEGRRCVGVTFRQNGQDRTLRAAREVILSGGAVNSPHLLQVSGIGPGAHLRDLGLGDPDLGRQRSGSDDPPLACG